MTPSDAPYSPEQQALLDLWERHMAAEFQRKSAAEALETMVEHPIVNHVPVLTGGVGRRQLLHFYDRYFIPTMPADLEFIPISRTVGRNCIVDEFIFKFTHTRPLDVLLPGIPPTGRPVEIPTVVIIHFEGGKIAREHIYWDQATVLVQVGLLDPAGLPVAGVDSARKLLDPSIPSNNLMKRTIYDEAL